VDEVTLSGRLRLTGRLLLPRPPFLSRLEVAFLSPPQLDFRLGGLAAAADLPGSKQQRFLLVRWVGWLPPLTFQVVRKNFFNGLAGWAGCRRSPSR
jgi:hypothetical protein